MGFFQDVDVSKIKRPKKEDPIPDVYDENEENEFSDEDYLDEEQDFSDDVFLSNDEDDEYDKETDLIDDLLSKNNQENMESYNSQKEKTHIIDEYGEDEAEQKKKYKKAEDNNFHQKSMKTEKIVKPTEKEGKKDKMQMNDTELSGTNIGNGSIVDGDLSTKGILSIDGRVNGDVKSESSITIFKHGVVEGSVTAGDKLTISGVVRGNVTAKEIAFDRVKLTGNVSAQGKIKITKGTIIKGNIDAKSVVIEGAVMGDIDIQGPVVLASTAVVKGTIKSSSLQMENGAIIDGMCQQCYGDADATSIFDEIDEEESEEA